MAPAVAEALGQPEKAANRAVASLIDELDRRRPDGRPCFELEGNAAVPLPEFADAVKRGKTAAETYPYEL